MPAGGQPMGMVYFAGVKLLGYSGYAAIVSSRLTEVQQQHLRSYWAIGAVRTAIGVTVGAVVGLSYWTAAKYVPAIESSGDLLFFTLLVPVRLLEWYLLLTLFYSDLEFRTSQKATFIGAGLVMSFLLDFLGIVAAFVLPGGMWIC